MLGEKIFEWKGTVQGQRVLPCDTEGPRMEVTFAGPLQGHGRLASFHGMGTATYVSVARADGTFYGEGQAMIMSDAGGFSSSGTGIGKIEGGKFIYSGGSTFCSKAPDLAWLNGVYGVFGEAYWNGGWPMVLFASAWVGLVLAFATRVALDATSRLDLTFLPCVWLGILLGLAISRWIVPTYVGLAGMYGVWLLVIVSLRMASSRMFPVSEVQG